MYLNPPPQGPIARFAAAVIGAALLVGAFMVGMVAIVILLGVGAVMAAWFWFRTRAVRRAFREAAEQAAEQGAAGAPSGPAQQQASDPIEAEYTVIKQREEDKDRTTG